MRRLVLLPVLLLLLTAAAGAALPVEAARLGQPRTHGEGITALAFAPGSGRGGTVMLAAAGDGAVELWDAGRGRLLHRLKGLSRGGICLAFSPDGRLLATGEAPTSGDPGMIRLWDTTTGKERQRQATAAGVTALAFAPDGKTLACAGKDRQVRLRDVAVWKEMRSLEAGQVVGTLAFSSSGERLVAGGNGEELAAWDTVDGFELPRLEGRGGTVRLAAFVPGGDVVVWVQGSAARSTDVLSREQHFAYILHRPGQAVALLDNRLLAQARGEWITLWQLTTGSRLFRLQGHPSGVQALAIRSDGKMVAAGGRDGTVLLWDQRGLTQGRTEAAWSDLASDDHAESDRAVRALVELGDEVVPLLEEHLRLALAGEKRLSRLLADLDDDRYVVREQASRELRLLGRRIEPRLRRLLDISPSPEVRRRVRRLLSSLRGEAAPQDLESGLRTIEVLARLGTPRARKVLATLAQGDPTSSFTRDAKAALARLGHP